jgi:hypothetical protein
MESATPEMLYHYTADLQAAFRSAQFRPFTGYDSCIKAVTAYQNIGIFMESIAFKNLYRSSTVHALVYRTPTIAR